MKGGLREESALHAFATRLAAYPSTAYENWPGSCPSIPVEVAPQHHV